MGNPGAGLVGEAGRAGYILCVYIGGGVAPQDCIILSPSRFPLPEGEEKKKGIRQREWERRKKQGEGKRKRERGRETERGEEEEEGEESLFRADAVN